MQHSDLPHLIPEGGAEIYYNKLSINPPRPPGAKRSTPPSRPSLSALVTQGEWGGWRMLNATVRVRGIRTWNPKTGTLRACLLIICQLLLFPMLRTEAGMVSSFCSKGNWNECWKAWHVSEMMVWDWDWQNPPFTMCKPDLGHYLLCVNLIAIFNPDLSRGICFKPRKRFFVL
jgi:hypothetical protein